MKKTIQIMVYRPTIFQIEAENFEEAKKIIMNRLIETKQMKISDPIYFEEIIEGIVTENKKKENKDEVQSESE